MRIDAKYLNPFFSAAYEVIREMSEQDVERGRLKLNNSTESLSSGFAVVIGVISEHEGINGRVIMDMTKETAVKFAEKMNFETIGVFNELVKSSMGEIGNMVSGRAISALQNEGYDFNITPPTLLEGENMAVTTPEGLPTIMVPLQTAFGLITINLALAAYSDENE